MTEDALQSIRVEEYSNLLGTLHGDLPRSSVVVNWLRTQIVWLQKIPELRVQILCPGGDWRSGTFVGLASGGELGDKEVVVVYATSENASELRSALLKTKQIAWRHIVHVLGVLYEHALVIEEVLKTFGISTRFTDVNIFYMTSQQAAQIQLPQHGEEVRVRQLTVKDEDVVCDRWMHYTPEKRPLVTTMLLHNHSIGVEVSGELAVTLLESHYGGLGLLHTETQHRGKGLATLAVATLSRSLGQQGHHPLILVTKGSDGALNIALKLGFTDFGKAAFIYVKE